VGATAFPKFVANDKSSLRKKPVKKTII